MAAASSCGVGASISDTPAVPSPSPSSAGPSCIHWSVTGAGRSASDTMRFRAGHATSASLQTSTSDGSRSSSCSTCFILYWGWFSPDLDSCRSSHASRGRSKSKQGRITAPWGRRATAFINSRVAPLEPVEPATMTGSAGGLAAHASASRSVTLRRRASASGIAPVPQCLSMRLTNSRLRCQCAECADTSSPWRASGETPSPFISSIRDVRLPARSKAAPRDPNLSSPSSRTPTAWASSSLRRSFDAGPLMSGKLRSSASCATRRIRGSSSGPRETNSSWTRRSLARVFRKISARASASGGVPADRSRIPATSSLAKSHPGGSPNTRGFSEDSNMRNSVSPGDLAAADEGLGDWIRC